MICAGLFDAPRVGKLLQKRSGRRFEEPQFFGWHFCAPIPQAGSNGKSHTRVENSATGPSSWPEILLVPQHRVIKGDFEELTKCDAFIPRTDHEIFISQFVIHLGTQGSAKVTAQTHVP